MASLIFDSALRDNATGAIDFDSDTFNVMLVTSSYAPDKKTHTKRSDVTNEVVGIGYVAGGQASDFSVAEDSANDRVNITLGGVSWGSSTITARGAVFYKARGGLASADELVAYLDFGGDIVSSGGNWTLADSTLRYQN